MPMFHVRHVRRVEYTTCIKIDAEDAEQAEQFAETLIDNDAHYQLDTDDVGGWSFVDAEDHVETSPVEEVQPTAVVV
jgi:hypothetical protein